MGYDNVLKVVDGKPFRWRLLLVFFCNSISNAMIVTSIVFLLYLPENFRCVFPKPLEDIVSQNSSLMDAAVNYMIPQDPKSEDNQCQLYNRTLKNITYILSNDYASANTKNTSKIFCSDGYVFDNPYNIYSAAMEFGWMCENAWIKPLMTSLYLIGLFLGSFTIAISDRVGRRLVLVGFTFLFFVAMFLQSFSNNAWLFGSSMMISGCCNTCAFLVLFVLATECTTPEKRNMLSISSFVAYALGYGVTTAIFYAIPNWRWFLRTCGLTGILFISNLWLIPESPRWLMANGKSDQAKRVIKKMAICNKKLHVLDNINQEIEMESKNLIDEQKINATASGSPAWIQIMKLIFTNPKLLGITFVNGFSWFSVSLIYYGIAFNVHSLSGNMFLNNALVGLVEFPGLLSAYFAVQYISRPVSHGGLMFLSGIFCLVAALLTTVLPTVSTIAAFVGKSLNAGAFYVAYIHTNETFPTLVRGTFISLCTCCNRLGAYVAPYLINSGSLHGTFFPFLVISLISISSGIITCLFSPETRFKELPETVEDISKLKSFASSCCICVRGRNSSTRILSTEVEEADLKA